MTWHIVKILDCPPKGAAEWIVCRKKMWAARQWCRDSLSSDGVLWKHEYAENEWNVFYFAQPQDVIMFKLMFA